MPTNDASVGAQAFPLPAGTVDTPLVDPLIEGLLSYFAHWLNTDLNTKLANMEGVDDEAAPSGARFGIDPGSGFVRNTTPALYLWRSKMTTRQWTMLETVNDDELTMLWILSEREMPHGSLALSGALTAARNSLARATQHRQHKTFTPLGHPEGTDIITAYSIEGIELLRAEAGVLMQAPGQGRAASATPTGGNGMRQVGYPSLHATWRVVELVQPVQPVTPDDLTQTSPVALTADGMPILDRTLEAP